MSIIVKEEGGHSGVRAGGEGLRSPRGQVRGSKARVEGAPPGCMWVENGQQIPLCELKKKVLEFLLILEKLEEGKACWGG